MTTMQPELKVRVLEDKRAVFGDNEMRLLEAIERGGTLSDGAIALGVSYRAAWGKIKAMEAAMGTKLVETTVGGSGGGSSRLTAAARRLLAQYVRFRTALGEYAAQEFAKCFGEAE
jgi:molybdate transport system regulatory protein